MLEMRMWEIFTVDSQVMVGVPVRRLRAAAGTKPVAPAPGLRCRGLASGRPRSEEHTSELQSLMRISYAVFCLKKKNTQEHNQTEYTRTLSRRKKSYQTKNKQ